MSDDKRQIAALELIADSLADIRVTLRFLQTDIQKSVK